MNTVLKIFMSIFLVLSILLNILFIELKPSVLNFNFKNFNEFNEFKITNNSEHKISEITIGYKFEDNSELDMTTIYNIQAKTVNSSYFDISNLKIKDTYLKYKTNNSTESKTLIKNINDTDKKLKDDFKLNITINSVDKDGNIDATIN